MATTGIDPGGELQARSLSTKERSEVEDDGSMRPRIDGSGGDRSGVHQHLVEQHQVDRPLVRERGRCSGQLVLAGWTWRELATGMANRSRGGSVAAGQRRYDDEWPELAG